MSLEKLLGEDSMHIRGELKKGRSKTDIAWEMVRRAKEHPLDDRSKELYGDDGYPRGDEGRYKVWSSPPPGVKRLAGYACLGIAFPNQPPNTIVSILVLEAESVEALAAAAYPVSPAGVGIWDVPVMEVAASGATELERKLRG